MKYWTHYIPLIGLWLGTRLERRLLDDTWKTLTNREFSAIWRKLDSIPCRKQANLFFLYHLLWIILSLALIIVFIWRL